MAGYIYPSPIWENSPPYYSHEGDVFTRQLLEFPATTTFPAMGLLDSGAITPTSPLQEPSYAIASTCEGKAFRYDYYYRIHINPPLIDVGVMLSSQQHDINLWNAYFSAQTLNTITPVNAEGIDISGASPPESFVAMQEKTYQVDISMLGPSDIDAEEQFNFTPMSPVLTIIGRRSVTWYFVPQRTYSEWLEWMTDILRSYNGEQRLALREAPRQGISYDFHMTQHQFSKAKSMLAAWAHFPFGVPIWKDMQYAGVLSTASLSVDIDTTERDYRAEETVFIWESEENNEAVQVDSVTTTTVTFKTEITGTYTKAFIMPVREGKLLNGASFGRTASGLALSNLDFTITKSVDLALSTYPQYRGFDVFTDCRVLLNSLPELIYRETTKVDSGKNRIFTDPVNSFERHSQTITWLCKNRSQLWEAREWLHSRYGKQKSFWLPSWNKDLVVTETIGDAAVTFRTVPTNYYVYQTVSDIRMELTDGSIFYRRVLGSTSGVGYETMEIDSAFGVIIEPEDVVRCSFMSHVRLNSDRIEIQHLDAGVVTIIAPVIEVSPDESS